MKRHVLFIHGGGERVREADKKLAASLRDALGFTYDVRYPEMPEADRPEYEIWKGQIAKECAALDGRVILVGHSLGAAVLLKYLSEEEVEKPVAGLFLVAAPYWGAENWEVGEYILRENFASRLPEKLPMFLYHSRDDEVVPFAHWLCTKRNFRRLQFASSMAADTSSATIYPKSPGTSGRLCDNDPASKEGA